MPAIFDPDVAIYPFPPKPAALSQDEKQFYRQNIKRLLKARNAVLIAHYYTDPEIQSLAEETGGLSLTHWRWLALVQSMKPQHC